mmetsp:Transcript_21818/g.54361  ORF Transcript_21818/g.54361 Transcript_21818/m.54361 type:complete len:86 (+) Transcript_21818:145-402(+)
MPSARCEPKTNYANVVRYSLALRWFGCLRGIERSERELRNGLSYDWVVRVRPDYKWDCVLGLPPSPIHPCGSRQKLSGINARRIF